jgi:hypothetical protein
MLDPQCAKVDTHSAIALNIALLKPRISYLTARLTTPKLELAVISVSKSSITQRPESGADVNPAGAIIPDPALRVVQDAPRFVCFLKNC